MDVLEHYKNLLKNSNHVFENMIESGGVESLTTSHNYLIDYDKFKISISERPESAVLDWAVKEYQFALFALICGQYRHAFGGLRLFFELMLSAVKFSANEIDYRLWAKDEKDINWNGLINSDNGIFSKNFINAFNPSFSDSAKQYKAIAEKVYRECSEYVHGNAATHLFLPIDINFKNEIFDLWHEKANTMKLAIVFAFSARYLNFLNKENLECLEPVIMDVIGHLPCIQMIFSKTSEGY